MTLREVLESILTAALCVAVFFGLAWLTEPPDEPEPPQAADYRALMDAQQKQREFNEWRAQEARRNNHEAAALFAAAQGEAK